MRLWKLARSFIVSNEIKRGDVYFDDIGCVAVMAFVDGYVVARRKGCIPFVKSKKEFLLKFKELGSEK